ncbi:MAG TPA: hypothetical protein VK213_11570 [Bacteroidales bacterium]|nr:hypothetical protein [Bacteroidales bacterium]
MYLKKIRILNRPLSLWIVSAILFAALGGPMAFSSAGLTARTALIITILISAITYLLIVYSRHMFRLKNYSR